MNVHIHCRGHSEALLWPLEGLLIWADQRLSGRKDVNIEHMDKRERAKWAIPHKPGMLLKFPYAFSAKDERMRG